MGLVLAALSLLVMPGLSYAQRRTGRELGSGRLWPTPEDPAVTDLPAFCPSGSR